MARFTQYPAASIADYADATTEKYNATIDQIRDRLKLTTLKYQTVPDLLNAIGLSKEKVCTYCWDSNG